MRNIKKTLKLKQIGIEVIVILIRNLKDINSYQLHNLWNNNKPILVQQSQKNLIKFVKHIKNILILKIKISSLIIVLFKMEPKTYYFQN